MDKENILSYLLDAKEKMLHGKFIQAYNLLGLVTDNIKADLLRERKESGK